MLCQHTGRGLHLLDKILSEEEFATLLYTALLTSSEPSIRIEIADLINTLYLYEVSH